MLQRLKVTSYALLILLLLVLPSQADEYCTTADMCAAAAQAEGLRLGNDSYPFALPTNTYGCWYYPRSHANKNYAGSAFGGVQSSDEQMKDPDPGAAHHVRLKCGVANAAPITGFCTTKDACASTAQAAG